MIGLYLRLYSSHNELVLGAYLFLHTLLLHRVVNIVLYLTQINLHGGFPVALTRICSTTDLFYQCSFDCVRVSPNCQAKILLDIKLHSFHIYLALAVVYGDLCTYTAIGRTDVIAESAIHFCVSLTYAASFHGSRPLFIFCNFLFRRRSND